MPLGGTGDALCTTTPFFGDTQQHGEKLVSRELAKVASLSNSLGGCGMQLLLGPFMKRAKKGQKGLKIRPKKAKKGQKVL